MKLNEYAELFNFKSWRFNIIYFDCFSSIYKSMSRPEIEGNLLYFVLYLIFIVAN